MTDANKNIGQLMDAYGNVVTQYEYSPFGRTVSASGPYADANPFRFSSEYFDIETELIYYNYRYYIPALGRWTKHDPIGEKGGKNLYSICLSNVTNTNDEQGLENWAEAQGSFFPTSSYAITATAAQDRGFNMNDYQHAPISVSTSISLNLLFGTHEIVDVGKGCLQYCFSYSPTTLLGMGASKDIGPG